MQECWTAETIPGIGDGKGVCQYIVESPIMDTIGPLKINVPDKGGVLINFQVANNILIR